MSLSTWGKPKEVKNMKNLGFGKIACIVTAFCFATAVVSTAQTYTNLADFDGTDGNGPNGTLVQGLDGNFYGTTLVGGPTQSGTVFRVTPAGEITNLHSFCLKSGCPDGARPIPGLTLATNGKFYGTTSESGGTVFAITPNEL